MYTVMLALALGSADGCACAPCACAPCACAPCGGGHHHRFRCGHACNGCNACNVCNNGGCGHCFARWRHHRCGGGCGHCNNCGFGNCGFGNCAGACGGVGACGGACVGDCAGGVPNPVPGGKETLPTPKGKTTAANGSSAQIVIDVPAEARLFIDDQPTTSVGARRTFVTPDLGTDVSYDYTVRVEVARDGRTYRDSRTVQIRGGQVTGISFVELGQNATVRTGYSD